MKPEITRYGILDMQVCVPKDWTDEQVLEFAEANNPGGWQIRREGDPFLNGDPERVPCDEREGFVHIMLDA